ncbi:MAG: thioredoxin [Dehalococcoidia bacterium]|nr:thioredoxin [Chloroflexota bacterium]MCH2525411.1 thioredoxin [Dehalococcoidia bacterium]MQG00435.1 thioredoxin [SAR202 cluster bacterium]|tara:strand:+ start:5441 stop:5764 length:324 start_codon:yes stop_codon:yes gene_type:complete
MAEPIAVSENDFDKEVLESGTPVLVDFWADWCGPCKMIAPSIDELASELDGQIKFAKVDVDENPGIAMKYGIRGIPTLLVFKDGAPVDQMVGAQPKSAIKKRLEAAL